MAVPLQGLVCVLVGTTGRWKCSAPRLKPCLLCVIVHSFKLNYFASTSFLHFSEGGRGVCKECLTAFDGGGKLKKTSDAILTTDLLLELGDVFQQQSLQGVTASSLLLCCLPKKGAKVQLL